MRTVPPAVVAYMLLSAAVNALVVWRQDRSAAR